MRLPVPVIRPADVRERIRLRVVARLEELGMTAREFALRTRPGEPGASLDSWVVSCRPALVSRSGCWLSAWH